MEKGLNNYFEDFLKREPLFLDKKVLQSNYIPETIHHREDQIKKVAGILAPALRVEKPSNMFIYGKTGCISGNSFVYTSNGYKKIKDVQAGEKILSYDVEKRNYKWKECAYLEFENTNMLLKIRFHNGFEIIVTKDHPLLIDSYEWKKADELQIGDRMCFAFNYDTYSSSGKYEKISLPFVRLLAFTLSDENMGVRKRVRKDSRGYFYNSTKMRLRISSNRQELLSLVQNDCKNLFPTNAFPINIWHTCQEVQSVSQEVCMLLHNNGVPFGKKSNIIRIPECIFQASSFVQKEFLKALFSSGGFVSSHTQQIEYYSNSKFFLLDIQLLLYKDGIKSRVSYKKARCNGKEFDSYRLSISGKESLERYFSSIGFYNTFRQERLLHMLSSYKIIRKTRNISEKDKILYSPIVFIEEVFEDKVYDLSVPGTHSFIANGLISHNSGKTLTVQHVSESMMQIAKKNNLPIKIFYLNCKLKRVADTEYRLIAELARFLKTDIPATGLPTDQVYKMFLEVLEKEKILMVLILDEIDQLVSRSGDQILYSLTRINSELKQSQISLVGISNDLMFTNYLDPRVKSSLSEEELVFPPYNAIQLQAILKERADKAFRKGAVAEGVLEKCAAYAAREHGDARRALELLRVAGELAERNNIVKINLDSLDEAEEKIEKDRVHEIITSQPKQSQVALLAIFGTAKAAGNRPMFTGDIYELYKEFCTQSKIRPLTQRRISDIIAELDMLGIINAKVISKGRYGRTRQIGLGIPNSSVPKLESLLREALGI